MNWKQLVNTRDRLVPAGSVTTYAEVSRWGYGNPDLNQPVRSLLLGARNHGHLRLTNRVVGVNGVLINVPDGSDQQRRQLRAEGVLPFTSDGKVDLSSSSPEILGQG